ncbi:MAG TPA: hypothetical protein VJN89_10105 [Candidatus Acidoferrum sp.]|nr:hypothetical protein [Candidatus Acidoferrum sp.]
MSARTVLTSLIVTGATLALVAFCAWFFVYTPQGSAFLARSTTVKYLPQALRREIADTLISDAGSKMRNSDDRGNVDRLKEASLADPVHPQVWRKLCEGYQLVEELDQALDACQQNIKVNPDGLSYNSLGLVYMARKDYVHASQAFQVAAQASGSPQVHSNLVWTLLASGQYERGVPEIEKLIQLLAREDERLKPDELKEAYSELGFAYHRLGKEKEAQAAYAQIHRIDPTWPYSSCDMKLDAKGEPALSCR